MPKLDGTHIHERLRQRLEQLKNGEEVARRELETLLAQVVDVYFLEQQHQDQVERISLMYH